MPGKPPTEIDLIEFVINTHRADRIPMTKDAVINTLNSARGIKPDDPQIWEGGERPNVVLSNPYAIGHFIAFDFIFKNMVTSPDFPCKSSLTLTNQYHSDAALWWLKELHVKMLYPAAKQGLAGIFIGEMNPPKPNECGVYRCQPKNLAFTSAPDPQYIQPLLHLWLLDIAEFHEQIKDKINNPYGLTQSEAGQLYYKSLETCLFLSSLQPFEDGNNRIARLVENAFRLKWSLPWRQPQDIAIQLGEYQTKEMPKWMAKLKDVR